jgi:hypothetical protein
MLAAAWTAASVKLAVASHGDQGVNLEVCQMLAFLCSWIASLIPEQPKGRAGNAIGALWEALLAASRQCEQADIGHLFVPTSDVKALGTCCFTVVRLAFIVRAVYGVLSSLAQ